MAEQATLDTRNRVEGSVADRKPQPFKALAQRGSAYGVMAALVPSIHWIAKCFAAGHGHFQYVAPDDTLQDVWYVAMLPTLDTIGVLYQRVLNRITGDTP